MASLAVALLAIGTTVDVTLRYVAGSGVPGMIEYISTLMVVVVFLGLAQAQRQDEHIGMDLVVSRLPASVRRVVVILALVITAVLLVWMTVATTGAALESYRSGEFRFGLIRVPLWPAKACIPLGLGLLLAEVVRTIVGHARALAHGDDA